MTPKSRLLQLSQAARYALSAAAYLARDPSGIYRQVSEISHSLGVSTSFLAKVLQRLVRAGILESRRGTHGGHRLASRAANLALLDVVSAVGQSEPKSTPCMIEARPCDARRPCVLHRTVAQSEGLLWKALRSTRLADYGRKQVIRRGA